MGKFSSLESVDGHKARALAYAVDAVKSRLDTCLQNADLVSGSPIEAIFYLWWEALSVNDFWRIRELDLSPQFQTTCGGSDYRVDFGIVPSDVEFWLEGHVLGIEFQRVGLEMDGHDFHERTKDQVILRNQRDRDLQAAGWKMLHFSGTELFRDPVKVVQEAALAGTESLNTFSRLVRAKKRARGDYGK